MTDPTSPPLNVRPLRDALPKRYERALELRQLLGGIGDSTLRRWIAKGLLPAPIKLPGCRTALFDMSAVMTAVDAWSHRSDGVDA